MSAILCPVCHRLLVTPKSEFLPPLPLARLALASVFVVSDALALLGRRALALIAWLG